MKFKNSTIVAVLCLFLLFSASTVWKESMQAMWGSRLTSTEMKKAFKMTTPGDKSSWSSPKGSRGGHFENKLEIIKRIIKVRQTAKAGMKNREKRREEKKLLLDYLREQEKAEMASLPKEELLKCI